MKTVVLGVFDEVDDARRVLAQLADSPLDLATVEVVHADPEVQRTLAEESGLPSKRTLPAGIVVGALFGGAVGAFSGSLALLASLGPVLSGAAGLLLGAGAGAALGTMADTVRLPADQTEEVVAAVDGGATAVVIQTDNVPTARAIRDLFQAGGSLLMPASEPSTSRDNARDNAPLGTSSLPPLPDEHRRFAPPWRRRAEEDPDIPNVLPPHQC